MIKGERIVIEKVGNGYTASPLLNASLPYRTADLLVFNKLGEELHQFEGGGGGELVCTLLGFIESHFKESE